MNYESRVQPSESLSVELSGEGDAAHGGADRKRIWIIAALLLAAAIIAGLMMTSGSKQPALVDDDKANQARVTVMAPGSGTVEGVIKATGTLAARREMPVGVVGEGGRVVSVSVEAGDWVRQGQILAVIDRSVQNQQAASQAAQINVAQADADLAQANLDRALQLVERGFISKADIDRLTATRDAAVARVQVARAQFAERRARNAQLNIVAPAAGLVLSRNVETGQVVSPGSGALFSIARGGELELMAKLGETELASISTGTTGKVTPVGTTQEFTCQVWQKAPTIDQQSRQGTARCALAYDPSLRPGGFASIELASGTVVAPMLPESAVLSDDAGSYVYIVDKDNKVVRRTIELGAIRNEGIVIASGLDGSERVVLRAGGFLSEGETVRPVLEKRS